MTVNGSDPKPGMMEVVQVPIAELKLDSRNPRRGNVEAIIDSLREFGQHRSVVVRRANNQVVAGNHMVKAAKSLGWTEVSVFYVDDDEPTALRRAIADNAVGDTAKWDDLQLASLLEEVGSDIPGVDDGMADRLNALLHPEPDPEVPIFPVNVEPGERYDYLLIVAQTEVDAAFLETAFGLNTVKSYKSKTIGRSRVITVDTFQRWLVSRPGGDAYGKQAKPGGGEPF